MGLANSNPGVGVHAEHGVNSADVLHSTNVHHAIASLVRALVAGKPVETRNKASNKAQLSDDIWVCLADDGVTANSIPITTWRTMILEKGVFRNEEFYNG